MQNYSLFISKADSILGIRLQQHRWRFSVLSPTLDLENLPKTEDGRRKERKAIFSGLIRSFSVMSK